MITRVLLLAFLSLWPTSAVRAQEPLQTPIQTLDDQPLPVTISAGVMKNLAKTAQVQVSFKAEHPKAISSIGLYLLIVHGDHIVGGEGWSQQQPGESIVHDSKLALHEGDSALLVVNSVSSGARTFSVSQADIGRYVALKLRRESALLPKVQISMLELQSPALVRVQGAGTFCSASLAAAVATCGAGQVQSFSCNNKTEEYSFACKGPAPNQD